MPSTDPGAVLPELSARRRILGLPKNIFFLGLTSFFNDFSSEMVFAVFPAFFVSVLKAGASALGLVDGLAEGVADFFKIYSGVLSDRIQRRKPLVVAGYALSVATRPFYIFVTTVAGALSLRVGDRAGKGLRDSPRDAIISLSTPRRELGRSFGYHRAMDTAGSILGPLVAFLTLRSMPLGFNAVFITAFLVGIAAVAMLLFVSDVALRAAPLRGRSVIGSFGALPRRFKLFLIAVFFLSVGSLPVAVVLLKTQSLGLAIADIPLFYMVYSIAYAAFSTGAGSLSDRIGAKTVIAAGYLVLLVSYFFLATAGAVWALAASFFVFGLFPALTDGTQRSLASQLAAEDARGGAFGFFHAAIGIGALGAGIGGGYLWQAYSPASAFMAGGIAVLCGLALLALS